MRLHNALTCVLGAAGLIVAAPVFASSSSLECRDTLEEISAIKAEVSVFNNAVSALRKSRKTIFQTSIVFGDDRRIADVWSHVFSITPNETKTASNETVKQWHYSFEKLAAKDSSINKDGQHCVWVRSESLTDVFEVTTNTLTKTSSKKIITDQ